MGCAFVILTPRLPVAAIEKPQRVYITEQHWPSSRRPVAIGVQPQAAEAVASASHQSDSVCTDGSLWQLETHQSYWFRGLQTQLNVLESTLAQVGRKTLQVLRRWGGGLAG